MTPRLGSRNAVGQPIIDRHYLVERVTRYGLATGPEAMEQPRRGHKRVGRCVVATSKGALILPVGAIWFQNEKAHTRKPPKRCWTYLALFIGFAPNGQAAVRVFSSAARKLVAISRRRSP